MSIGRVNSCFGKLIISYSSFSRSKLEFTFNAAIMQEAATVSTENSRLGVPRQSTPDLPQKWATARSDGELPGSLWKEGHGDGRRDYGNHSHAKGCRSPVKVSRQLSRNFIIRSNAALVEKLSSNNRCTQSNKCTKIFSFHFK